MDLFLHRTQSNVGVDDDTEDEDSLRIPIDGENQLEEEEQTGSEVSMNIQRAKRKRRKDLNKFQTCNKEGVDKIHFLKKKIRIRSRQESLTCSLQVHVKALKCLPRHFQLKVKAEVMKAVINAETKCLDHGQFRNPTIDINHEIAAPTYFQQL
jgi:hypothetical protein